MTAHVSQLEVGTHVQHTGVRFEGAGGGLWDPKKKGTLGAVYGGQFGEVESISSDWRDVTVHFPEGFSDSKARVTYHPDGNLNIHDLRIV